MKTPPFSADGIVVDPVKRTFRRSMTRLLAGLALAVVAAGSADAGYLNIGSVTTFRTGASLGNPTGTWTLEDKNWTYLDDSGNWNGIEDIQLTTNFNPLIYSNQFLVDNLFSYTSPIVLQLGYRATINGVNGPNWTFYDARMGEDTSGPTVDVWQDIYGSLAAFNANTTPGSGTLMTHHSINGSLPPAGLFPLGLTQIWVRNSIELSAPGGGISSMSDTFRQSNVPEIDPTSFGSALSLLFGTFGILERRSRRRLKVAVVG